MMINFIFSTVLRLYKTNNVDLKIFIKRLHFCNILRFRFIYNFLHLMIYRIL